MLSHYSAENIEGLISILTTNRNAVILIDSDKRSRQSQINDTKKRIRQEFETKQMMCWITKGKEIENYIPAEAIRNLFSLKQLKQQTVLNKMEDMPYRILEIVSIMQQPGFKVSNTFNRKVNSLWSEIFAYGSADAIKILSHMQHENYDRNIDEKVKEYRSIGYYVLLVTQIKYDVTGINVSPETWYELKINDYSTRKNEIMKVNNTLVEELELNKKYFMIN